MAEIHLSVADAVIRRINLNLNKINGSREMLSPSELGREALGLYSWATEKIADDYAICAVKDGKMIQVGTNNMPVQPNSDFPEVYVS